VALSEPIAPGKLADVAHDPEAAADGVEAFYARMRRIALRDGEVISKHIGGVVPDNPKGQVGVVRQRIAEKGRIPVGKELSPDFQLAVKQCTMFTALLPALVGRFPCYAIVRNPLSILGLKEHQARDDVPGLRYDPVLQAALPDPSDPVTWHVERLHLYVGRYLELLPRENVIRYEDVVASGGRALSAVNPGAASLEEPLESKNLNPLYDREEMRRLGERLLGSEGACWRVYDKVETEDLLRRL
jgi:hypothetical protein